HATRANRRLCSGGTDAEGAARQDHAADEARTRRKGALAEERRRFPHQEGLYASSKRGQTAGEIAIAEARTGRRAAEVSDVLPGFWRAAGVNLQVNTGRSPTDQSLLLFGRWVALIRGRVDPGRLLPLDQGDQSADCFLGLWRRGDGQAIALGLGLHHLGLDVL